MHDKKELCGPDEVATRVGTVVEQDLVRQLKQQEHDINTLRNQLNTARKGEDLWRNQYRELTRAAGYLGDTSEHRDVIATVEADRRAANHAVTTAKVQLRRMEEQLDAILDNLGLLP